MAKSVFNYSQIGKKSVDQLIELAFGGIKKARNMVQVAGVAVLMHAEKHGDYTKANTLVEGLGNSMYGASLVAWFVEYGGLVIVKDGDGKESFGDWNGAEYIRDHFQDAKATAWYDVKKQANPYAGFNLQAELLKLLERASKAQTKAIKDSSVASLVKVDDTLLHTLKGLVSNDPLITATETVVEEQAKAA